MSVKYLLLFACTLNEFYCSYMCITLAALYAVVAVIVIQLLENYNSNLELPSRFH